MRAPLVEPPTSEGALEERARSLSGFTLSELGARIEVDVPESTLRAKGLAGRIVESVLGATAGSRAEPDFPELGIELKTIPLDPDGKPAESTFVCSIRLNEMANVDWEQGIVYRKLRRVLFVPVEADRALALGARRVGTPFLWSPSEAQEALLRRDWELLAELIARGEVDRITGHLGEVLQVRPKAANARARRRAPDEEGSIQWALPRGFYLRTSFTREIVAQALTP